MKKFIIATVILLTLSGIVVYSWLRPSKQELIVDKISDIDMEITEMRIEREKRFTKDNEVLHPIIEKANRLNKERDDRRAEYDRQITELKTQKAELLKQVESPLN